jgi:glyoxylase-like metal-dependent hydrolase (beta-lactamase superfamily II)
MNTRHYIFPDVIELNLQARRPLGVNIYLLDGGSEYALLDIGQNDTLDDIIDLLRTLDFPLNKCKLIIATHADADHVQALAKAKERMKGVKTAAHPAAALTLKLGDTVQTYAKISAQNIDMPMPPMKIDQLLNDGDTVKIGKLDLQVWHTPGHTPGQLSFKLGQMLFSGDNIYADGCVGVIDAHHGSNIPHFIESLKRIQADDAEFILPSHGPMFRKDNALIQGAIDRLTRYQYMADFGTCAIDWPLQREWEKLVLAGGMPNLGKSSEPGR